MKIFKRVFLISSACLLVIYGVSYTCFAMEGEPLILPSYSEDLPPSPMIEYVPSFEEHILSPPDEDPAVERERPAGEGADDESSVFDSGDFYLDSGEPDLTKDVYAIRQYTEFFLFGVFPISVAILLIVFFCVWFQRTFFDL